MPGTSETGWVADQPAPGIVVHQPVRGFRYCADAFWVAGYALEPGVPDTALDLGTGSGIVAFLLAAAGCRARGIDVYDGWREGWARSLADSEVKPELAVQDVLEVEGPVDVVTCNPPYFLPGAGKVSKNPFKASARTEGTATLADFVRVAIGLARQRAVFVVPSWREPEVLGSAGRFGVARRLAVGRKRVLLDLRPDAVLTEDLTLDRDHPRLQGFTRGR